MIRFFYHLHWLHRFVISSVLLATVGLAPLPTLAQTTLRANPQLNPSSRLTTGQKIDVLERISFAPGGTSAVVEGTVVANSSRYYILHAQAKQLLQVSLSPVEGVQLSIAPGRTSNYR